MENKRSGFLDDAQSLRGIIGTLPYAARADYESYGCRSMEPVFPNRYLVVYTLHEGKPERVELWRFGDISLDRITGPIAELELPGGHMESIGVTPKKMGDREVYLHIPQSFELKWRGKETAKGLQFVPHYAVLIKTRSREHSQTEGHTYCVTLNKFRERFPGADLRY